MNPEKGQSSKGTLWVETPIHSQTAIDVKVGQSSLGSQAKRRIQGFSQVTAQRNGAI